jgi:hypothetical protein
MSQQSMDLESEQFMTLLTDALRAGPGSPEWHQAVGVLRSSGAAGAAAADEYQMLVRAREDLESGRDYHSVRAGTGFTRKVLQAVEEEGSGRPRGLPSANLIAIVAALVILVVVIVIAVSLVKNTPAPPNNGAVEQLRSVYFLNPVAQWSFDGGGGAADEIGPEWRLVGEVPLKVNRGQGLGPANGQPASAAATTTPKGETRDYRAGAIVLAESVPPDQARMLDVTLRTSRATDAVIAEVFVAEGSPEEVQAGGGREVVWLLKGGAARVALADGKVPMQGEKVDPKKQPTVNVKVRFNRETVVVENGEERLYEGPHKLAEAGPRYVGVRFRRKAGDTSDGVWLTGIKVSKP